MDKNARYSLIALGVLAVAASAFAVFALSSRVQISASTEVRQPVVDRSVPLKVGNNALKNGPKKITLNSKIIAVNSNLISVGEAIQKEIVGSLQYGNYVLGKNTQEIPPNADFSINLIDGSKVIEFLPEEI